MKRLIREARQADMAEIMQIFREARDRMCQSGNPHQWQANYPSENVVMDDIERHGAFVVEEEDNMVAYFAVLPSPEPTYKYIYNGTWIDDILPYHIIHRIASRASVHRVFESIIDYCFSLHRNIRIDTHRDNKAMLHNLAKHGFIYCGIIHLANGAERLAFQKVINI